MQRNSLSTHDHFEADQAACRAMLRNGSRTFYAASLLLPRRVREPAIALYAFCREADDIIDIAGGSRAAVAGLRRRLERAYRAMPDDSAVDRAFARVIADHGIPRRLPDALIEGFEWDAEGRRYQTLGDLKAYATRVAGTVGAMMAVLMGVRDTHGLARACDLGVAMQLTNIARDVGEDARAGRIYLPLDWMDEAGINSEAWLLEPVFSPALAGVIDRLLNVAGELYLRSQDGIFELPLDCRPGISAARLLYSEIGLEVRRQGLDSVGRRAVVPPARKIALLARALSDAVRSAPGAQMPVLAEAAFLVDSVVQHHGSAAPLASPSLMWWHFKRRAVRVIEIFERLEQQERNASTRKLVKPSRAKQNQRPIRYPQPELV